MAKTNINSFITDRVLRFNMMDQGDHDNLLWSLTQVTDPSIAFTSESQEITDAIGNVVANIDRSQACEITGSNAFFDIDLFAAQHGTSKEIATSTKKIVAPVFVTLKAEDDGSGAIATVTLDKTPIDDPTAIYYLNGDSTLSNKCVKATAADVDKFAYAAGVITLPTAITLSDGSTQPVEIGDEFFIQYEYEMEAGVAVTATATEFPKAGYGVMEQPYVINNALLFNHRNKCA